MWFERCLFYPYCISRAHGGFPDGRWKVHLMIILHTDNGSKSLLAIHHLLLDSLYHQSSDATTSFNASLLTTYQWKSGCPVDVRHRCHIRLFGSTNLVDLMTSGIGKYTLCVLHTPVVMPLKPANAPCTCKVYRTIDGQAWKYSILSWGSEEKLCLTAFWPSTVHRMASDALARTARSMYVGSIYLTSEWTPISLKWDLICGMAWQDITPVFHTQSNGWRLQ